MVVHHWPNDGILTCHRQSLLCFIHCQPAQCNLCFVLFMFQKWNFVNSKHCHSAHCNRKTPHFGSSQVCRSLDQQQRRFRQVGKAGGSAAWGSWIGTTWPLPGNMSHFRNGIVLYHNSTDFFLNVHQSSVIFGWHWNIIGNTPLFCTAYEKPGGWGASARGLKSSYTGDGFPAHSHHRAPRLLSLLVNAP